MFSTTLLDGFLEGKLFFAASITILDIAIGFWRVRSLETDFPTVNAYSNDFAHKKAHRAFLVNARQLIIEGFQKFNGPFRIITPLGPRVILPPKYTEWVKKCPDVDHQAYTAEAFFAGYPGFESQTAVVDPRGILLSVIKSKLSHSIPYERFNDMMLESLKESWQESEDWKSIEWSKDAVRFVSLMSSSVFVGPDLARDAQWQRISTEYTINMFMAVKELSTWPKWSRPWIHWFLPAFRNCRQQVTLARSLLQDVVDERARSAERHEDAITWVAEAAKGRPVDAAGAQLGLAMAALFTTSELMKQALLDICAHPELVEPLRQEITSAIEKHGWTTAGFFNMQLLDSAIKESQRMNTLSEVNLERKAIRDVQLPDGQVLKKGTNIAVWVEQMRSPDVYEMPDQYDGYRYLKLRENGGKWASAASLVSTSPEHFVFGMGKALCPGRFFAANEVKAGLAAILLNYDVRLKDGYRPKTVRHGFEITVDPEAKIEIKKRE